MKIARPFALAMTLEGILFLSVLLALAEYGCSMDIVVGGAYR